MTYRERREARAERLRGWAEKRAQRAAAVLASGEKYRGDVAFNTQPGHIPARARLIAATDRAFESMKKAESMSSRAAEIERQADRAIYSDDHDAIEKLEARIADLEAERARVKLVNTQIRRGAGWEARIVPPLTDRERQTLLNVAQFQPFYDPQHKGFPPYHLQNLGGNITRQRQRLAQLRRAQAVDAAGPDAYAEAGADTVCPDGATCHDPECMAERARLSEVAS